METFKVGQRVRIVAYTPGVEAVIAGITSWGGEVAYNITPPGQGPGIWLSNEIAPLTDPKADAFLESIRQLKPLHVRETA